MLFRKNVVVRAGKLLFCVLLLAGPPLLAQSNTTVRIMAANLNGNTQSYQPFALRIFQGLAPDIVAIQEFNYGNNTPADFRSMLDTAFGTNFVYFRENFTGSGDIPNGIISRYPIIASGSWADTVQSQPNRGFAWAQIDLPGTNDLYVLSVHLLTSSATARASEAANLMALIQSNFPSNAWIVVAGDFNTDTRTEAAMSTFETLLSDNPIPTDAEAGGDSDTSVNRNHPHDYVLPSFSLANVMTSSVFASHSFSNGLVFDSRVYTPLTDVAPVQIGDSSNAQHMAVLKDFNVVFSATNSLTNLPAITTQPQNQTVTPGTDAAFTVAATGDAPLNYQWYFNNANGGILGATSTSYTRTNVQAADTGGYFVVVTNLSGSVTSVVATLSLPAAPVITNQPQSQTVFLGQSATFNVGASSGIPLSYQWRFNGTNISGATTNGYTRSNVQTSDAGIYSVVVTNAVGSATSAVAILTVTVQTGTVLAQWNFNSIPADANTGTGSTTPSVGAGTATALGGVSQAFFSGSTTDPANSGTDNSGWSTTTYPAQGSGNKTAGVQFNVSTAGRQNIVIRWDQRQSNTGSKYVHLLYTTNGTTFITFPTSITATNPTNFEPKTNSLAGMPGVDDNPNFAFRIVTEFESTAINNANANYVAAAATSSYGTAGTIRFDMMTVSGAPISSGAPAAAPVLSAPAHINSQFQFNLTGTTGSNYIIQGSTNPTPGNWTALQTNPAPFTFVETNAAAFPQRYYRGLVAP